MIFMFGNKFTKHETDGRKVDHYESFKKRKEAIKDEQKRGRWRRESGSAGRDNHTQLNPPSPPPLATPPTCPQSLPLLLLPCLYLPHTHPHLSTLPTLPLPPSLLPFPLPSLSLPPTTRSPYFSLPPTPDLIPPAAVASRWPQGPRRYRKLSGPRLSHPHTVLVSASDQIVQYWCSVVIRVHEIRR